MRYEDLTREMIEETMREYQREHPEPDIECRELSQQEVAAVCRMFGCLMDGMGPRLYKICGAITGQGGWDLFMEALRREVKEGGSDETT